MQKVHLQREWFSSTEVALTLVWDRLASHFLLMKLLSNFVGNFVGDVNSTLTLTAVFSVHF